MPMKNAHRVGFDLEDKQYIRFKKRLIDDRKEMSELLRELVINYLSKDANSQDR